MGVLEALSDQLAFGKPVKANVRLPKQGNVGAAPAPGLSPKFPAYGEVSVFQHGELRMGGIVSFSQFTRHDAA